MKEAIKVIEAYQQRNGIVGFLETLQAMQSKYHELYTIEQMSFDQFMTAGREMFMADGNEQVDIYRNWCYTIKTEKLNKERSRK